MSGIIGAEEFWKPAYCLFCGNTNVKLVEIKNNTVRNKVWLCKDHFSPLEKIGSGGFFQIEALNKESGLGWEHL